MAPSKAGGRRRVQAGPYGPEKTERAVIATIETSCAAGAPLRMKKTYTGYWQPPKEKTTTNIL